MFNSKLIRVLRVDPVGTRSISKQYTTLTLNAPTPFILSYTEEAHDMCHHLPRECVKQKIEEQGIVQVQ